MPVEHKLKTFRNYWDAIERGEKTFEVRRDDRGFQKGDTLVLLRCGQDGTSFPEDRHYSDNSIREVRRKISYILTGGQFGIDPGYVVLGLKK